MKFRIIALVAFAGILWACHKPTEDPFADAPWAIDETLPVPIKFNASNPYEIITKGEPVEDLEDLESGLKMFAADMSVVNAASSENTDAVLFSGVPVQSRDNQIFFRNEANDDDISRFYPQVAPGQTRYNYSFVSYRTSSKKLSGTGEPTPYFGTYLTDPEDASTIRGTYFVDFLIGPNRNSGIDRNIDVLYARANASDVEYDEVTYHGFNAQHARKGRLAKQLDASVNYTPYLDYKHKTALIIVKIVGDASDGGTFVDIHSNPIYTVSKLTFRPVWTRARLNLDNGELGPIDKTENENRYLDVHNEDGSRVASMSVTTTEQPFGTGIFVIPGKRTTSQRVAIGFTITDSQGNETEYPYIDEDDNVLAEIELDLPEISTGVYGYQSGYKYVYTVKIKSAESISIDTHLTDYDPFTGSYENPGGHTITLE